MRIAIIAPGSQGDVEPYIALSKGLKNVGNVVRLVTHQDFETLVNSHGLEFWPVEVSVQDISDHIRGLPVLYGFSPSVIPQPSDWGDSIHVTGYWFLDPANDWNPPLALTEFLQAGPPCSRPRRPLKTPRFGGACTLTMQ